MSAAAGSTDTLDLAEIAGWLRRGWRWVAIGVAGGAIVALLVILFGPRRFDASASAIIRAVPEGGASMLSKLGDGAGAASLLGIGASAPIETDIQILSSRAVANTVVDSLLLQVEGRDPAWPAMALVREAHLPGAFKHFDVTFARGAGGQYTFESRGVSANVASGGRVALPVGTLVLQTALPESFTLRLFDHEDAVVRSLKNLSVSKAGGEVVRVGFRARDSVTAAAVPNAVLSTYLSRRKREDRGTNAHRAEFLRAQIDSNALQQADAEERLRRFQERSGLIDPQVVGKLELETVAELQKNLGTVQIEERALDDILGKVGTGRMSARQLVGFPSFLKSPGINDLLRQLAELETERTRLLERRLESDDQVQALTRSIANLDAQLVPLATAYTGALRQQRSDIVAQISSVSQRLASFPGAAQEAARATREVLRLGQLSLALQTQLVQARLAAVTEGGDVRALDRAVPPKVVAFPEPWLTTGIGIGLGLLLGAVLAIISGAHGRFLEGTDAIERLVGIPVVRYLPGHPLLLTGRETTRTLLLVPVVTPTRTASIAVRLAETALARGETSTVVDLSEEGAAGVGGHGASGLVSRAEDTAAFVVVQLPGLAAESTAALLSRSRPVLLVAPGERVERRALTDALDTLRRLDVPCVGVVLAEAGSPALASG